MRVEGRSDGTAIRCSGPAPLPATRGLFVPSEVARSPCFQAGIHAEDGHIMSAPRWSPHKTRRVSSRLSGLQIKRAACLAVVVARSEISEHHQDEQHEANDAREGYWPTLRLAALGTRLRVRRDLVVAVLARGQRHAASIRPRTATRMVKIVRPDGQGVEARWSTLTSTQRCRSGGQRCRSGGQRCRSGGNVGRPSQDTA